MSVAPLPDLQHVLLRAAAEVPERGVAFVSNTGSVDLRSFPRLRDAALRLAGGLARAGLRPADVAMLAPTENEAFVVGFWGCLFAGVVPAPLPPPGRAGTEAANRLLGVSGVLDEPRVLVDRPTDLLPAERQLLLSGLMGDASQAAPHAHVPEPDDLAFLQFSSGSTGHPKGVQITHRNALANLMAIHDRLGTNLEDRFLSWLPLYHDMGLVGFHLSPMYSGVTHWLLPTARFLRRPLLWIDLLDAHQISVTAAPNFSQALVVEHLARAGDRAWDLSNVRTIVNGAEPIASGVMASFSDTLAAYGLRPEAMLPAYGLAEAVLAATAVEVAERPVVEEVDRRRLQEQGIAATTERNVIPALHFVGCGLPLSGVEVRIRDASGHSVAEGTVGQIEVRGQNVTSGYYGDAEATAAALTDGWLHTGDLGYLRNGQLFVTGRIKDLLFVNGQNVYADDIERTLVEAGILPAGRVAVCGVFDEAAGTDQLVLFAIVSVNEQGAKTLHRARRHLQHTLLLTPRRMIPLRSRQMARTSSGKLQRFRLRERLLRGEYAEAEQAMAEFLRVYEPDQIEKTQPRTWQERLLHKLWCESLGLGPDEVGVNDRFGDLGGTSLHVAGILARLESEYRIPLHSTDLAEHDTIAALATLIERARQPATGRRKRRFGG